MTKILKIFLGAALAWAIFWLAPKLIATDPNLVADELAQKLSRDDELILNWMVGFEASCKEANPTMDSILGEGASSTFCFCMARSYVLSMTQKELLSGNLPERIDSRRSEMQDACLDEAIRRNQ